MTDDILFVCNPVRFLVLLSRPAMRVNTFSVRMVIGDSDWLSTIMVFFLSFVIGFDHKKMYRTMHRPATMSKRNKTIKNIVMELNPCITLTSVSQFCSFSFLTSLRSNFCWRFSSILRHSFRQFGVCLQIHSALHPWRLRPTFQMTTPIPSSASSSSFNHVGRSTEAVTLSFSEKVSEYLPSKSITAKSPCGPFLIFAMIPK